MSYGLFFICALFSLNLEAFSFGEAQQDKSAPLTIDAQKGMICSQDKKNCIALGTASHPVTSTKGTSVLTSQKLMAHFQDSSSKNQQESSGATQNIKNIEAFGNVRFFDAKGGFVATGQYANYIPRLGELRLKGNPILKDASTLVLAGSEVIFYEHARMAVTVGRSTIKQGDKLMQADVLKVYFTKDATEKLVFDRLEAEGNVVISTPTEIAKSRRGIYRAKTHVAELFDDVVLTRADGQLRGNYGRFDMLSGQSQLFNKKGKGVSSKRVQAILNPKSLKKKKNENHEPSS